jgi:hypothetical protein
VTAAIDLAVVDESERPVPHARVHVLTPVGAAYAPPVAGTTDERGVVRLTVPDASGHHRVEVLPAVLRTQDHGAPEVLPFERLEPSVAALPEAGVRGWYAASHGPWRAADGPVRVRSWVRARVRVFSPPAVEGGAPVPAPGIAIALLLGDAARERFVRVATTDVEGRASFWLFSRDLVGVLALSNGLDRFSDEVYVGPQVPTADLLLRSWRDTGRVGRWDRERWLREVRDRPMR